MLLSRSILFFWVGVAFAYTGMAQSIMCQTIGETDPEVVFAYVSKNKAGERIPATAAVSTDQVPAHKYAVARQVFDALVDAKGNRAMQRPELLMNRGEQYVAWMDPKRVAIGLEEKAYDVCAGFGADSLNALAAILGHELTHYYEKHNWQSPLSSGNGAQPLGLAAKTDPESVKQEEQADYLGGFLAYAAGFNAVGIIPQFLSNVYQAYKLPDSLDGYPTLPERVALAKQSLRRAEELVYMFETAGYLVALKRYEEAAVFYQAILKDFQSREVYNNAGVSKVLNSFQFFLYPQKVLRFVYPLELDPHSRLADIEWFKKLYNDWEPTSPDLIAHREALLQEAIQLFEQAYTLDANYVAAILNKACVYEILRQYRQARYWAEEALNLATSSQQQQIRADAMMVLGIIAANQADTLAANQYFDSASSSGSTLAGINRRIFNNEPLGEEYEHSRLDRALSPNDPLERIERVDLKKIRSQVFNTSLTVANDPSRYLSTILSIKSFDHSILFVVSYRIQKVSGNENSIENSLTAFHLTAPDYPDRTAMGVNLSDSKARILEQYGQPEGVIHLTQGDLLIYFTNGLIFQTDNTGKVVRWVVFWEGY